MKKVLKSKFFIVMLLLIIGAASGVGATLIYNSNKISYTPTDSTWNVTDVKGALDDLYEKSKTKVYYLGTGTSFDIKQLLPDVDYTKLTANNFLIPLGTSTLEGGFYDANGGVYIYFDEIGAKAATRNINLTKTYDNTSGILTITTNSAYLLLIGYSNNWNGSSHVGAIITPSVYLVLGDVINI